MVAKTKREPPYVSSFRGAMGFYAISEILRSHRFTFYSLEEALACDIVTLHVPFIAEAGPTNFCPTRHLIGAGSGAERGSNFN